jgi:hypothetical protein
MQTVFAGPCKYNFPIIRWGGVKEILFAAVGLVVW